MEPSHVNNIQLTLLGYLRATLKRIQNFRTLGSREKSIIKFYFYKHDRRKTKVNRVLRNIEEMTDSGSDTLLAWQFCEG